MDEADINNLVYILQSTGTKNFCERHSAIAFILTAIGGFMVGFFTSKLLQWVNPDPGTERLPIRHIHDHHHFHHKGSIQHDSSFSKVIG